MGASVSRLRPALAVTAALSLTVAAAAPALGATVTTPATGAAQSALTILDVSLGGHQVQAGTVAAVARTAGSRLAQIVVTPATVDSTAYGKQTITPASAPATVPSGSPQTVSVPNLLDLTGPTLAVDAQDGATAVLTSAVLKALGQLTLKPAGLTSLPVDLTAASLDNLAKVTSSQSEASKTIVIGGLSLPSISQLLSSLGVDLTALLDQLTQGNLTKLGGLVDANLATLNAAVDTAQAALTSAGATAADSLSGAQAALAPAQAAVTTAQSTLTTAQAALTAANDAWNTAFSAINPALLPAGVSSTLTPAGFQALAPAVQTTVDALTSADLASLAATAVNAQTAVDAAQTALTAAQNLVTLINNLIDALQALVTAVASAVTGNTDPLAALGNITVQTKAVAATTSPTPVAEAKVGTLKVLGSDALPSQLTSVLGAATKTLTDVLTSVSGVTFTPPSIQVGAGNTATSTVGTTRKATASITGLTITLPSIALPTSLSTLTSAIPGAATITNGVASVLGGTVHVAVLAESASYTPATTTTKTPTGSKTPSSSSGNPSLADTGLTRAVPAVAALLVIAALAVMRRRARTEI
jgi:hypothetical protein